MARPQIHDDARVAAFVLGASRTRYLVMRQEDVWFITFNGEEFGPYQSERQAMLFATDAAKKLGELGASKQAYPMPIAPVDEAPVAVTLAAQPRAHRPVLQQLGGPLGPLGDEPRR